MVFGCDEKLEVRSQESERPSVRGVRKWPRSSEAPPWVNVTAILGQRC
jgi:hypothetical protein